MLFDKRALELLYNKCIAYIDEQIRSIVEAAHQSMVGGAYVKIFDRERLNMAMGSGSLTVAKFREFLDWLANVFGFYDKEIEDLKNREDALEEKVDAIDTADIKEQNYIRYVGAFGDGVESINVRAGNVLIHAKRNSPIYVLLDAVKDGVHLGMNDFSLNVGADSYPAVFSEKIREDKTFANGVNVDGLFVNMVSSQHSTGRTITITDDFVGKETYVRFAFKELKKPHVLLKIVVPELHSSDEDSEEGGEGIENKRILTWRDGTSSKTISAQGDVAYVIENAGTLTVSK